MNEDINEDSVEQKPRNSSALNKAGELGTLGFFQILSLFPQTAPIGAAGAVLFSAWQAEQQQKFVKEVEQRLKALEQTKLDRSALDSDEFKALLIQVWEIASKTASDLKRQAFASALVSSIVLPTSRVTGKQALLRLLEQLSDEEMVALKVLYDEEPPVEQRRPLSAVPSGELPRVHIGMSAAEIASRLRWSEEDALIACQGLRQLGLVHEPDDLGPAILLEDLEGRDWRVTALAEKLIKWCGEV